MGMTSYGVHTVWIKERLREISALSAAQTCSSGYGHVTDFLSNNHFCFSKCLIKSPRSSFNRRHQVLGRQNHFYVLHNKMNFLPCQLTIDQAVIGLQLAACLCKCTSVFQISYSLQFIGLALTNEQIVLKKCAKVVEEKRL